MTESERKMKEHGLVFSFSLLIFQVIMLGLFAGYTTYDSTYNYRTKANISRVQHHVPSSASKYYTCEYNNNELFITYTVKKREKFRNY